MKESLTRLTKAALDEIADRMPEIPDLSLTSRVEVPIYVIHHGRDPEVYEIICDFEKFMAETQQDLFRRPALKVWAGRRDFERHAFAHELRKAFSAQFQAVRDAYRRERDTNSSWFSLPRLSLLDLLAGAMSLSASLVGNILLMIAMSAGKDVADEVLRLLRDSLLGRTLAGRSGEDRLESMIEEKKGVIDAGLADLEIVLHPDLYRYAYRTGAPGPMTGMDKNAWPLPSFVAMRMES